MDPYSRGGGVPSGGTYQPTGAAGARFPAPGASQVQQRSVSRESNLQQGYPPSYEASSRNTRQTNENLDPHAIRPVVPSAYPQQYKQDEALRPPPEKLPNAQSGRYADTESFASDIAKQPGSHQIARNYAAYPGQSSHAHVQVQASNGAAPQYREGAVPSTRGTSIQAQLPLGEEPLSPRITSVPSISPPPLPQQYQASTTGGVYRPLYNDMSSTDNMHQHVASSRATPTNSQQPKSELYSSNTSSQAGTPEDEVRRLRALLTSVTAELSRQISGFQTEGKSDGARVEWLQKLLVQMEARQALVEGELKDAHTSARKERDALLQQVDNLEKQNMQMRLVEGGGVARGTAALSPGLEEKVRSVTKERDDLRARLDEMQNRHTMLQRKMLDSNEGMSASTSAISKRLQESEAKASSLISQKQQLLKEMETLRKQLLQDDRQHDVARVEAEKMAIVRQRDDLVAKYQADLQAAQAEVLEGRKQLLLLQQQGDKDQAKVAAKLSQENGDLTKRIYELEHQNVVLSKTLADVDTKCRWLQDQVSVKDATMVTLSNLHGSKLEKRKKLIDQAARRTVRNGSMRRMMAAWLEQARTSGMRAYSLFGFLKTVEVRWHKRFYKNHFMVWKHLCSQRKRLGADSELRWGAVVMRACLDDWAFQVRDGARLKREEEMKDRARERELEVVRSLSEQHEEALQHVRKGTDTQVVDLKSKIEELRNNLALVEDKHEKQHDILRAEHKSREDAANDAHQQMVRMIKEDNAALVKDMEAKHEEGLRKLQDEHATAVRELLQDNQDKTKTLMDNNTATLTEVRDRHAREVAALEASALAAAKEASRVLEEAMHKCDAELARQVAELRAAGDAKAAQDEEERKKAQHKFEQDIMTVRDAGLATETVLREQLVNLKKSSEEAYEKLLAKQSDMDIEWRRKLLDKERELAAQLEEAEAARLLAVEDGERELRELQRECDRKMDEARQEHVKVQDELRQRMQKREKELSHKMDAMRAESIKAQETWQVELRDKEHDFRLKLEAKEADFKTHLDSLISNRATGQLREMAIKLQEAEDSLAHRDAVILECRGREAELRLETDTVHNRLQEATHALEGLQSEVEALKAQQEALQQREREVAKRLQSSSAQLEQSQALQAEVATQLDKVQSEADEYKARVVQLDEMSRKLSEELRDERSAKEGVSRELKEASQALLKRGDEFSSSVRVLQARLESSDKDMRELLDKLAVSNKTNARLAAELEQATLLLSAQGDVSEKDQQIEVMRKQMVDMEAVMQSREQTWQQKMHTAHGSQSALEEALQALQLELRATTDKLRHAEQDCSSLMEQRDQMLRLANGGVALPEVQQRLLESEALLEQVQRQMSRVERENATLTEELDNVLMENAQLRQDLDNEREHRSGNGYDEAPSESGGISKRLNRAELSPSWERDDFSLSSRNFPSNSRRGGITLGVHTVRLLRASFVAWQDATVDMRMVGKTAVFSGLEHFMQQDGSLAEWFPCGRLRRHEIEVKNEKLGSGTFAEVFRGEWRIPVAVKRMKGPMGQKELYEFIREGEMVRTLSHPCIVKLIGVHTDGQNYSLIQEIVNGCNLFDYLHKYHKTVPIGKQLAVALQICDAMCFIHEHRIVHRDVKPQNVIYKENSGIAKLCDFGLARLMPMGMTELHPSQLGTGGTPAYQGPEVLKRHPVGMKLDLYGFAVTLWEMYTCKLPWSDCNLEQMTTRVAIMNERPPVPFEMPREYADIINRSWATDPQSRPGFSELLPILRELYNSLNPSVRGADGSFMRGPLSSAQASAASTVSSVNQGSGLASGLGAVGLGSGPPMLLGSGHRSQEPGLRLSMSDRSLAVAGMRASGSGRNFPEVGRPAPPIEGGMSGQPQFQGHLGNGPPASYPTSYGAF